MNLSDQLREIELALIKPANKDEYSAYSAGKNSLRKTYNNDIDILQAVFSGFIEYYGNVIKTLPEAEQKTEWLKQRVCSQQFESIIKTLNFDQNKLESVTFLYYLIGYVNDVVGKRSI